MHPYRHEIYASLNLMDTFHHQDSSAIERLPEENVSIIETPDGREDRPENVKAIGTTRKKLYFNPAYFEPHLLQVSQSLKNFKSMLQSDRYFRFFDSCQKYFI